MHSHYKRLEFHIDRRPFDHGAGRMDVVMFIRETKGGADRISVVQPLTLAERSEEDDLNGVEIPTTFSILAEEAQRMMDELWRVGVRPTQGEGSAGQLSAVTRHLEDMRTLVFKTNGSHE